MARFARNPSRLGDLILRSNEAHPIPIRLDTQRKGFAIRTTRVSTDPNAQPGVTLREWYWANGKGGAGTSIETPQSYADGACASGEFVNLRRKGVAQPAGKLTELPLPNFVATYGGRLMEARVFGSTPDLWLTTLNRYILKVPGATGASAVEQTDFGTNAITLGTAIVVRTGIAYLVVGCYATPLQEWDGATWTPGEADTLRGWLATPYWTISTDMATGGAAGSAGSGAHRLVGTNNGQYGIYHCDANADPKVADNWSGLTPVGVGGTSFPIARIVESNRVVWMATGLGILGVDGLGYSPNQTKWVEKNAIKATLYLAADYWAGLIWFATHEGLSAFRPDGNRVDLAQFLQFGAAGGATPIYGRPRALCGTSRGLYVGYYNEQTATSYIGCLVQDEDGTYRWSMAEAVVADEEVTLLAQVSGSDDVPRLFIGTIGLDGIQHLYTQSLPVSGDPETDYLHGGPFVPAPEWSLTLSRFNNGRTVSNSFRRWMLEADQLGDDFPSNTVEVQVSADGGAFSPQGTATSSPRWSSQPRTGYVDAVSAQIKLVVHNTDPAPVIVRSVSAHYSPRPERTQVTTFPIVMGEGRDDPAVLLTRLEETLRAGPITWVDHYGRTVEGLVESLGDVTEEEAPGKGWTVHSDLTISTTRRPALFDVDSFDVGRFS